MLCYIILYYIILYYTILYYIILYYIILYIFCYISVESKDISHIISRGKLFHHARFTCSAFIEVT
jgi:hypothetical protein